LGWYGPQDLESMEITEEIKSWSQLLFDEMAV
jgi:hypothetical protein